MGSPKISMAIVVGVHAFSGIKNAKSRKPINQPHDSPKKITRKTRAVRKFVALQKSIAIFTYSENLCSNLEASINN